MTFKRKHTIFFKRTHIGYKTVSDKDLLTFIKCVLNKHEVILLDFEINKDCKIVIKCSDSDYIKIKEDMVFLGSEIISDIIGV